MSSFKAGSLLMGGLHDEGGLTVQPIESGKADKKAYFGYLASVIPMMREMRLFQLHCLFPCCCFSPGLLWLHSH